MCANGLCYCRFCVRVSVRRFLTPFLHARSGTECVALACVRKSGAMSAKERCL